MTKKKQLRKAKEEAFAVRNSTYVLGKNPENLSSEQELKLKYIAETQPALYRAYVLKESLRTILHMKDADTASGLLDIWLSRACRSRIKPMVELSGKIRRHKAHILNTIKTGLPNARIESVNNKIKLIIRKAYGFRDMDDMFNMIYPVCSNISVPLPNRIPKTS